MFGKMRFILFLTTMWLCQPLWAGYQFYKAEPEDAEWYVESSPLACRMIHDIPAYGEAVFFRKIKSELAFTVNVKKAAKKPDNAHLRSLPPEWKHFSFTKDFGLIPVVEGNSPFYLSHSWASKMIVELKEGMDLHLNYRDLFDGQDEIDVRVSALNFSIAWDEFQGCERGLLKQGFTDVKQAVFLYSRGQTAVSREAMRELDRMIKYMKADPSVRRVRIDGYTDSKGLQRVTIKTARARANAVKAYFRSKGIKSSRISTYGHGELEGKFTNRTETGRKKNRRVEVKLIR